MPLVTLSAAAGAWSDEQTNIAEPTGTDVEWIAWDGAPRFTKGMFVARVDGHLMEPHIPDGAYCLFRQAHQPSGADRPVLVRHAAAAPPTPKLAASSPSSAIAPKVTRQEFAW